MYGLAARPFTRLAELKMRPSDELKRCGSEFAVYARASRLLHAQLSESFDIVMELVRVVV
jgi:hypothetical protein